MFERRSAEASSHERPHLVVRALAARVGASARAGIARSALGLGACALAFGLTVGCGGEPPAKTPADEAATTGGATPSTAGKAQVTAFTRAADSLKVDKVGGSDGALAPDGNPDAAYTLEVEGPIAALVVVSVDASGKPTSDFQTDTLVGDQKLPADLAVAVAEGKHSAGLGVAEGDKLLNAPDGSVTIPAGKHTLTLYFANTGVLEAGAALRVYAIAADQSVVPGPTAAF